MQPRGMGDLARLALGLWLIAAATVAAQEPPAEAPTGPPPPSGQRASGGQPGLELLPELGRIGAQVGAGFAAAWTPYDVGRGWQGSGFIDLPLAQGFGGRLSYEIFASLSDATSAPFVLTDSVAFVANLAAGFPPDAALAGPPRAPFPVRREVRTRLRLLHVAPFSLRHTFTGLDRLRLRPYVTAGAGAVVVISKQEPVRDESAQFFGTAPFDAPLIGGQIAQAPELEARGLPTGQGNIELGLHAGAGFELRVSPGLSLNLDYRFTRVGDGQRLHVAGGAVGFHW